jgi:trehalose 6-phosphate synthase/phosphatase
MNETKHFKRLIIASYRLPYKFSKVKDEVRAVQNSGGLVSAVLSLSEKSFRTESGTDERIIWTGTADGLSKTMPASAFKDTTFEIVPVNIPSKLNDKYYGGFCNDLIWPLFHYFIFNTSYKNNNWEAYKEANRLFCEELLNVIKPGDFVWVHDYQLMLLPEMLREKSPEISIGFFLHIPFPSFEIFRLLPRNWRSSIIKGLLGADLIGFHTNDYTQNFIKSVKRTTGYECHQNKIYTPDKVVKADAFPIGIDYGNFLPLV